MSSADSPFSGSSRVVNVDVAPAQADEVVEALRDLAARLPTHPVILPIVDAGVDARGRPFTVTAAVPGEPLDQAWQAYGPAALADALPHLERLADALDLAKAHGLCHGVLHPRDIFVAAGDTCVAGVGVSPALAERGLMTPGEEPYAAPEVRSGGPPTSASDQFALAVIAHEWLFGWAIDASRDRELRIPALPDVDRAALERTFATALTPDPSGRFASCRGFVEALGAAAVPGAHTAGVVLSDDIADLPLDPDRDSSLPIFVEEPVPPRPRPYGFATLVVALLAGLTTGVGAMLMLARPSQEPAAGTAREFTDAAVPSTAPPAQTPAAVEAPVLAPPRDDVPHSAARPAAADAVRTAQSEPGVLVHSMPAGARVAIDGVDQGTTPVAVRGLALGERRVAVSRAGYQPAERTVTLTIERPTQRLEFELTPLGSARSGVAPAEARSAAASAAAASGSLLVDSRPRGAAVFVDGRRAGVTPLVLASLAAGTHTVRIEQPGYRPVTTTVQIRAGERARVAARLEGG